MKEYIEADLEDSRTIKAIKSISAAEVTGLAKKVYNGQEQTQNIQTFTVTLDGRTLTPETDYSISSYENNVNAGQAAMTITGQGFYKDTKVASFTITGKPITKTAVSSFPDVVYTNRKITPEPTVVVDGVTLEKDVDYEVSYGQNTNAGTPASVTVTGIGNYSGEVTKTFNILPVSIRKANIPMINDQKYTGNPVEPYPSVKYNDYGISRGIDFTMTYSNNIEPGTATVVFTGIGNFKDSVTRTFTIKEPTSGGGANTFSSVILSPLDNTEYPDDTEITVEAKGTNFYTNYIAGQPVEENLLYFKITRDGEEVFYDHANYTSQTNAVTLTFTADEPGVYLIQTEWDYYRFVLVDGKYSYTFITSDKFVPDASIRVYVGTPAPERGIKDIASAAVTGIVDKPYTGHAVTQTPVVKVDGETLVYGKDYYLTYLNNFDIGPASVKVHGKGKYTGTTEDITFNITACPLSADMISLSPASFTYNGKLQKPSVTVKHGSFTLDKGVDYTLENAGGTEPGSYTVKITAASNTNYTGSATKTYKINGIPITNAVVTVDPAAYVYDGSAKKPGVTVKLNGEVLSAQNYTVSYSNNVNAGTAQAVVTAKAGTHYAGTASGTFMIGKYDIASNGVTVSAIADATYNRSAQKPAPAVTFGGKTLQKDTDYTLQYSGNTNAGTAEVTITGKGNFKGSRKQAFTIGRKDISAAGITVSEIPKQQYTEGSPSEPAVTVKDGNAVLSSEEIAVSYKNNNHPGNAVVTITGKGNYTGSREVAFEILERKAYAEDALSEIINEVEQGGDSQYHPDDKKELQEAIAEAKNVLNDDKADAQAVEKALAKVEKAKKQADSNLGKTAQPANANTGKKAKADAAAADTAVKVITNLPAQTKISLADKAGINAAVKAYEALSKDQKKLVPAGTVKKLQTAKKLLTEMEAEASAEEKAGHKTVEAAAKTVAALSDNADPAGSDYTTLAVKAGKVTKKSIQLKWKKVSGADGYIVFANKCGRKNKYIPVADVKNGAQKSYTLKKISNKALSKNTYYKVLVAAYKITKGGEQRIIATGKSVHAATSGGKKGNPAKLTLKKKSVKVRVKKSVKLKVKQKAKSGKKIKKHRAVAFESSNPEIATVSRKGVIKGKKKGKCTIYVYAQNGLCAKVKVKVSK
ncbi:MAG: FIVAR domain-containing protein [Lachnospiraceae bacterium]|nr:FIVAR domain-containing protein [Lachnospiraceae bacterium]